MINPEGIEAIGEEIAIRWDNGTETYCSMEKLRKESPSAENKGETDLTGNRIGGCDQETFPGVKVTGWEMIGGYAIQFTFSDGHNTGIFSYDLLQELSSS
ncbi:MAG: DUF971 domain-containing protein [Verrucomicrobiota bacterium]|nr:DUF971 domain-containing protein [Verrucomicrobiota bacterium]